MFKWLKDKVNKKMNNEMHNCIIQNLNFVYMVEARKYALKDNINEEVMSHVYMIKDQSENINFFALNVIRLVSSSFLFWK